MTPRRLVALATLSAAEYHLRHDPGRDTCPTGPMTSDDLGIPAEVTRPTAEPVTWRRYLAHMLAVFGWLCLAAAVTVGLVAWAYPVWAAL